MVDQYKNNLYLFGTRKYDPVYYRTILTLGILDKFQTNQNISIDWDATNNLGQKVPSGIYIGKLETDKNSKNIKMLLLKDPVA